MDSQKIRQSLRRSDFWTDIQIYDELSSSIDTLKQLADDGAPQGTAVVPLAQTSGRGRSGRAWSAPPGGVWFSGLLRPAFNLEQAGCMSVLVAVSVAQAYRKKFGLPVQVKWPNDLWIDEKKLSGLLIDLSSKDQAIDWMIASIGTNVNNPLPTDAKIPPISLSEALGHSLELEDVAATVMDALADGYEQFLQEGFAPFIEQWERLSALPDVVHFERNGEVQTASVVGLSEDGKLVVNNGYEQEYLAAEEVHLQRPQGSVS